MENFVYVGVAGGPATCHGSIKKVLRNESGMPIAIECTCGDYLHIAIYQFDEKNTYNIPSSTRISKDEIMPLLKGKCVLDESLLIQ